MTAAGRLVLDWAFDPEGAGLARLFWQAYVGNWPSRRTRGASASGSRDGARLRAPARRATDAGLGTLLPDDPREPRAVAGGRAAVGPRA
nr:hypothetical protein [Cellulosimicrobium sp. MM]